MRLRLMPPQWFSGELQRTSPLTSPKQRLSIARGGRATSLDAPAAAKAPAASTAPAGAESVSNECLPPPFPAACPRPPHCAAWLCLVPRRPLSDGGAPPRPRSRRLRGAGRG